MQRMTSISVLTEKLRELRRRDRKLAVFGAESHRYAMNQPMPTRALAKLERDHGISLPDDHRDFLLHMGDGGAGPSYGVFPFGQWDGAGAGLESWIGEPHAVSSLRDDFPLTKKWSLPAAARKRPAKFASDEDEDAWGERLDALLYPAELTRGWFPICHHGCALRTYLVVSGKERGHVWYDARSEDGPVEPHTRNGKRLTFSGWYEKWLDDSLKSATH